MKFLSLMTLAMLSINVASAASIQITGIRAKEILRIAEQKELADHAMGGRAEIDLANIRCIKMISNEDSEISCTLKDNMFGGKHTLSTKDHTNADLSVDLRNFLKEVVGGDKKINATTMMITASSIKCSGFGAGHDLDSLENEPRVTCTVVK